MGPAVVAAMPPLATRDATPARNVALLKQSQPATTE
jgi:hypothetical protein